MAIRKMKKKMSAGVEYTGIMVLFMYTMYS